MKRLIILSLTVFCTVAIFAQSPQKMSYQAVIRNSSDVLIVNHAVGMKISILKDATPIYVETQTPSTNSNGLITIEIGGGTPVTGTFAGIDWSAGTYFIITETDPTGGTSYTIASTSQMLSVPYALHAKTVESYTETQDISNVLTKGTDAGNKKIININQLGVGTSTPNSSSALEISSTSQGFLPPRMTQAQRDAINPVNGLMVFNTSTKRPNYFDGNDNEWKHYDGTSAKTIPVAIGDSYQGGIVAYILQPGDAGYIAGQTHGLIAASSDQSMGVQWGCIGTAISGADGTAIGTGNQNTIDIVTVCTTTGIAAKLCYDLILNGYNDWYLPSKDELNKLYLNRVAIWGFANGFYWSSSESNNTTAWIQNFDRGAQIEVNKSSTTQNYVRAIRAF